MLPAEKVIADHWLTIQHKYCGYYQTRDILAAIKAIDRNTTGKDNTECSLEFFKEIVSFHKNNTLCTYHLLADVFVMTNGVSTEDIEYMFCKAICSGCEIPSTLYEKQEWINFPFKDKHLIDYINNKGCFNEKQFENILKNVKEPINIYKIDQQIHYDRSSYVLNLLYLVATNNYKLWISGDKDTSDVQSIYAGLIKTKFTSDISALIQAYEQLNFKGIFYMFNNLI